METEKKALFFDGMIVLSALFILLTGPLFVVENLAFWMVQIFGVILIIWALIAKRVSKHEHKLPKGYFFIKHGPYEIIRHPVYAGLFLIVSGLVQYNFTFLRLLAFIIFVVAIMLKIIREELVMVEKVPDYKEYASKTKKLIPYLF